MSSEVNILVLDSRVLIDVVVNYMIMVTHSYFVLVLSLVLGLCEGVSVHCLLLYTAHLWFIYVPQQ